MTKTLALTSLLSLALGLLAAFPASARDERLKFPIKDALAAAETTTGAARVDPNVRLYWGPQTYPKPVQVFGTYTSNKKTNFFNKSDKEGCEWVWLSAVVALQERAKSEGGNAVVNIKSVYRNGELDSETEYECGAGAFVGGVALRGQVVKLP